MSVRRFFRRRREDGDLSQEIQSHLAHEIDENVARGIPKAEATRQAYLKFGNEQQVREDLWRWNTVEFLDSGGHDLRFAIRTLRQRPAFVAVALLTLGLAARCRAGFAQRIIPGNETGVGGFLRRPDVPMHRGPHRMPVLRAMEWGCTECPRRPKLCRRVTA